MAVYKKHGKMKIIVIGPHPPNIGGISSCISNIERGLQDEFIFIRHNTTSNSFKILYKIFQLLRFPITLAVQRPDAVHIHTPSKMGFWYNVAYLKIAKILGKRTIIHIHGGAFKDFYDESSFPKIIRNNLNKADKVVVLSQRWYNIFSSICDKDKITIIPNSVDMPSKISTLKTKDILFMGSNWRLKGVIDIIKAADILRKEMPDIKFIIAGEDPSLDIKRELDKLGLLENFEIIGNVSGQKKEDVFLRSSLFILPSHTENFPITIIEAMSYGLPVISTSVGGIPEIIIDDYNGYIIEPGDYLDLAEKIKKILLGKRNVLGANGLKTVTKKFSNEICLPLISREYEK